MADVRPEPGLTSPALLRDDHLGSVRVGILRWDWLAQSETFIRRQCDGLSRVDAVPIGAVAVPSSIGGSDARILYSSLLARRVLAPLARRTGASRRLRRLIEREHLDLVHVHFAVDGIAIRRVLKASPVPFVVTLHGYDITRQPEQPGAKGRWYKRRLRGLFINASRVIAVSDALATKAVTLGADPGRLTVLRIGVPVPTEGSPSENHQIDVLFVGRIVEKKGVDDLITAISILNRRGVALRCVVVGDGPLRHDLEIRALKANLTVEFVGSKPAEEVSNIMRSSLMVAVPSKTASDGDMEGLPTVLVEAMATRVPVVSTRHSGIPEVVRDGETGLLGAENDPDELASNILQLMQSPQLRQRLSKNAFLYVQQHLDMIRQTAALEDMYLSVIADGKRPPRAGPVASEL